MRGTNVLTVKYHNRGRITDKVTYPEYDRNMTSVVEQLKYMSTCTTDAIDHRKRRTEYGYLRCYYGILAEYAYKFHLWKEDVAVIFNTGHYKSNGADKGDFAMYSKHERFVYDIKSSYIHENISITQRRDLKIDAYVGIYIQPNGYGEFDDPENMEGIVLNVWGYITPKEVGRNDLGYCPHSMIISPYAFRPLGLDTDILV